MEAPAKTGGPRNQRSGRDLIGRLTTLPPIRFLKRHNPLRRRRKVKLGFDQPRHEIQQLALPLRTAPPPLRRRMKLWLGTQWCRLAVVAGRVSCRTQRAREAMRSMLARANVRIVGAASRGLQRVLAVKDSRAGRWCAARLRAISVRLAPFVSVWHRRLACVFAVGRSAPQWQPTQAPMLMARVKRVRLALAGLVACEYTALVGLCAMLAILAVRGETWDSRAINLCGVILCALSLVGLAVHAWHQRLVTSWRSLDLFMCGSCGGLRNFSPSLPCPRCNSDDVPVFPGQAPATWARWPLALSVSATTTPAVMAAMLLLLARLVTG